MWTATRAGLRKILRTPTSCLSWKRFRLAAIDLAMAGLLIHRTAGCACFRSQLTLRFFAGNFRFLTASMSPKKTTQFSILYLGALFGVPATFLVAANRATQIDRAGPYELIYSAPDFRHQKLFSNFFLGLIPCVSLGIALSNEYQPVGEDCPREHHHQLGVELHRSRRVYRSRRRCRVPYCT